MQLLQLLGLFAQINCFCRLDQLKFKIVKIFAADRKVVVNRNRGINCDLVVFAIKGTAACTAFSDILYCLLPFRQFSIYMYFMLRNSQVPQDFRLIKGLLFSKILQ